MRWPVYGLLTAVLRELVARTRLKQQDPQTLHPMSSSGDETQHAKLLKPAGKTLGPQFYLNKL